MYSHPSPPYETSYEAYNSPPSMYQNYTAPVTNQSQGSPYNPQMVNQGSPMSILSHQNQVINQSMNGYPLQMAKQSSPIHAGVYDTMDHSQANHQLMNAGDSPPYHSPPHHQAAFSHPSPGSVHQAFAEIRQQRPSCDMVAQHQQQQLPHHDNNPYTQVSLLFELANS